MNNKDKILTLMGFCRKAGKLTVGTEKVTELIERNQPCLVILASDISAKTEKELQFKAKGGNAVIIRLTSNLDETARATGTTAGIFATTDEGFRKAILQGGNQI